MDGVRYRIVVAGQLGPRYAGAFEGMALEPGEVNTAIVGEVISTRRTSRGCSSGLRASGSVW